ncbi:hypothetical protein ACQPW1_10300 [Nocardia sp. CA-128927]|uniref:hypothetical protein n=1 Tax=Nocardia sp. CA-128927 TaxID=3239975 RepID=UPI003D97DF43
MRAPTNPFQFDPLAKAAQFEDMAARCLAGYFRMVDEARALADNGDATGADYAIVGAAGRLRDHRYWLSRAAQARAEIRHGEA